MRRRTQVIPWTAGGCAALALALAVSAAPLPAQDAHDAGSQAALRAEPVLEPVFALFDGMREKNAEMITGAFTDGATIRGTGFTEDGAPRLAASMPIAQFAERIAAAPVYVDEKIWDPSIQVHDNLAVVVVKYALYVDGAFSHCGVDAMHMFNGSDGWKIFHLADTRRTEDCWEPPSS